MMQLIHDAAPGANIAFHTTGESKRRGISSESKDKSMRNTSKGLRSGRMIDNRPWLNWKDVIHTFLPCESKADTLLHISYSPFRYSSLDTSTTSDSAYDTILRLIQVVKITTC